MVKTNLPVILLKGIILLPDNELRLEFDSESARNIVDVSELFHDNKVLVVSQINPLEEMPSLDELPKIGVVGLISHKLELPNGNTRVVVNGIARANVFEYLNLNRSSEMLESIVSEVSSEERNMDKERILTKKLYREMELYIKALPYISNSVLSLITNITDLSKMTDIIAPNLNIDINRLRNYLNETSPYKRCEMILEDIYKEKEMFNIEKEIDSKVRTNMERTQKEYILREKIKYIKEELGDISTKELDIEKIKEKVENNNYPENIKKRILSELKRYETTNESSPENDNIRNYIDWLVSLPWNKKTDDNFNLKEAKEKLEKSHYGLNEVKERIIEYLAITKHTNNLKSPIICLVGPPGCGKTSLAFSIADALNKKFIKMSVGGVDDEAEIKGHRRTYIGANPGRIIENLRKAKTMNPVFLIDEIDKMTKGYHGDPASALLEVLDPEQNKYFSDNYIEEAFDLSNVLFILTANYIEDIPEALKDRLEVITLYSYTEYEKLDIAKNYLIKKINENNGASNISFEDDAILQIIRHYTKEAGVRELERTIDKIVRKIVTNYLLENKEIKEHTVIKEELESYLGQEKYHFISSNSVDKVGVVNGLAYTNYGGDTLPIEVNFYKGNGNLILTGSLGDVMKESARIALSYLKANYKFYKINYEMFTSNDIHIHVPEGAVPKDGPSAGITITTALLSALTNKLVDHTLAMTGEITLRGTILPIGGLKEKSIGAYRNGIKKIIIPYDNLKDLEEVPEEIKNNIDYIPIKEYKDIIKLIKERI